MVYFDRLDKSKVNWIKLREAACGWLYLDIEMIGSMDVSIHFKSTSECILWLRKNKLQIDEIDSSVTYWNPYYVMEVSGDDEFLISVTDNEANAIREAKETYLNLFTKNRQRVRIEVRKYVHNIEVEKTDDYSYDSIEWEVTIPGLTNRDVSAIKKLYEYRSADIIIADRDWYFRYLNIIPARNGRNLIAYIDKDYEDENVAIYTDSFKVIEGDELDFQLGKLF